MVAALMLPAPAAAFHQGQLPALSCAADAAVSPSNNNGQAKEALTAHNRFFAPAPLPPLGPAGNSGKNPPDNTGEAAAHDECG
jgi:hypothetical protein